MNRPCLSPFGNDCKCFCNNCCLNEIDNASEYGCPVCPHGVALESYDGCAECDMLDERNPIG